MIEENVGLEWLHALFERVKERVAEYPEEIEHLLVFLEHYALDFQDPSGFLKRNRREFHSMMQFCARHGLNCEVFEKMIPENQAIYTALELSFLGGTEWEQFEKCLIENVTPRCTDSPSSFDDLLSTLRDRRELLKSQPFSFKESVEKFLKTCHDGLLAEALQDHLQGERIAATLSWILERAHIVIPYTFESPPIYDALKLAMLLMKHLDREPSALLHSVSRVHLYESCRNSLSVMFRGSKKFLSGLDAESSREDYEKADRLMQLLWSAVEGYSNDLPEHLQMAARSILANQHARRRAIFLLGEDPVLRLEKEYGVRHSFVPTEFHAVRPW